MGGGGGRFGKRRMRAAGWGAAGVLKTTCTSKGVFCKGFGNNSRSNSAY